MWVLWFILSGATFVIVNSDMRNQYYQSWVNRFFPHANPQRAQQVYRNYFNNFGRGTVSYSNLGNFLGIDKQQAEQLHKEFLKFRQQMQQKEHTQEGGSTSSNSPNFMETGEKFWTEGMQDPNKNNNRNPLIDVRFNNNENTDTDTVAHTNGVANSNEPTAGTEPHPETKDNDSVVNDTKTGIPDTNLSTPTEPISDVPTENVSVISVETINNDQQSKPYSKPKPNSKPNSKPKPKPKSDSSHTVSKECVPSETYMEGERQCKNKLIFQDSFDSIRRNVWNVDHVLAGAPDYEFSVYVDRPDTMVIMKPYLLLSLTRTENIFGSQIYEDGLDLGENCTGRTGPPDCKLQPDGGFVVPEVASARLNTKDKFSFKYGKVEIRAKLPAGDWLYPILYLNPSAETYGKYYQSGQIRVAFIEGNENSNKVLKGGVILGDSVLARNYYMKNITRDFTWADTFHKFGLIWRPGIRVGAVVLAGDKINSIHVSVDGEVYGKIEPPKDGFVSLASELKITNAEDWKRGTNLAPFDKEMYLQIGLGIGGLNFPDREDGSKPWKNRERLMVKKFYDNKHQIFPTWDEGKSGLKIDYIKVWAL